jgi:hypothetical protein
MTTTMHYKDSSLLYSPTIELVPMSNSGSSIDDKIIDEFQLQVKTLSELQIGDYCFIEGYEIWAAQNGKGKTIYFWDWFV